MKLLHSFESTDKLDEVTMKWLHLFCQILESPTLFIMTNRKEVYIIVRNFTMEVGLPSKVFEISLCNRVKFGIA